VFKASSCGRHAAMAGNASSSSSSTVKNSGSKDCSVADRRRDAARRARSRSAAVDGGSVSDGADGVSGSQHSFCVSQVRGAGIETAEGRTKSSTKRLLRLWLMVPVRLRLLPGV
jgi:hypothetical protein